MSQLNLRQPTKVYRGTVEEVFSHRGEIPPNAILEFKVFEEGAETGDDTALSGEKSALEAFPHLFGTERGGPDDISEHPEKYLEGFGKTNSLRTLEPCADYH